MSIGNVWILGRKVPGFKSLSWVSSNLPSFADCDILIVDSTTLNEATIKAMPLKYPETLFKEIQKRFLAGLTIITISTESFETTYANNHVIRNDFWSPMRFNIEKIPEGKEIRSMADYPFQDYLKNVKKWSLGIKTMPLFKTSNWTFTRTPSVDFGSAVLNKSRVIIGASYKIEKVSSYEHSGIVHVLPTLDDSKQAINLILKQIGAQKTTPPPDWTNKLSLPGLEKIENEIEQRVTDLNKIKAEVEASLAKKAELIDFRKLLFETDNELEEIVKKALKFIGMKNVQDGRSPELEDLLFDFENTDLELCVGEVKGVKKNLDLDDFRQLDNWVWDYKKTGKKVKGIMIANTNRLEDFQSSKSDRESFDDFEEYCNQHEICIMPTTTLFEIVKLVMEGKKLDRSKIEKAIANSKFVLKLDEII